MIFFKTLIFNELKHSIEGFLCQNDKALFILTEKGAQ